MKLIAAILFCLSLYADVTTGLLAHWWCDEGTGTTCADASGNSNTLTLYNSTAWGSGRRGTSSLSLTAASSHYGHSTSQPITGYPFTFCFWINRTNNNSAVLGLFRSASSTGSYNVWLNAAGRLNASIFTTNIAGGTILTAGQWYHVCVVYASNTSRTLYLNGATEGTSAANITFSAGVDVLAVGRNSFTTPSGYFSGELDDIRIWSRALSDDDRREVYGQGFVRRMIRSSTR